MTSVTTVLFYSLATYLFLRHIYLIFSEDDMDYDIENAISDMEVEKIEWNVKSYN